MAEDTGCRLGWAPGGGEGEGEHSVGIERERGAARRGTTKLRNQIARQLWGYILVRFSTEVSQREEGSNAPPFPLLALLHPFHPSFRFSLNENRRFSRSRFGKRFVFTFGYSFAFNFFDLDTSFVSFHDFGIFYFCRLTLSRLSIYFSGSYKKGTRRDFGISISGFRYFIIYINSEISSLILDFLEFQLLIFEILSNDCFDSEIFPRGFEKGTRRDFGILSFPSFRYFID